jgi:cellulose synthase/poly-beta-1,6-N-acetylglucosamine synthase-like glycosyltransferase
MSVVEIVLVSLYFVVLAGLCTLGAHRAVTVYLCRKHKRVIERAQRPLYTFAESELPHVTVQLPLYNEATVTARLIEAAGRLDYPRDRLEIQVLDDSSDETRSIAAKSVKALRERGIDAVYVRRPDRHGYKAGALDYGLKTAKGELVAMFDADFVPQSDFLRKIVDHFVEPQVGMVQTRWDHMNREANLLTHVQALMLDGHHVVENCARFGSGLYFNFAGTGGMWRVAAIEAAGGWEHDTLTEDLDLSYRAQMAGYQFIYRPDVLTPSELPEDMSALRAQQHRWAKGTVQTARKLLPIILSNKKLSVHQRIEATFHMLPHFAYPLMVLLALSLLPALVLLPAADVRTMMLIDLPLCFGATGSIAAFYATAERNQGRSAWGAIKRLPILIGLGAGLAPHLTSAVWSGLNHMSGEFVRTPKRGENSSRYRMGAKLPLPEMFLAVMCGVATFAAIETGHWFAAPFALLFTWGHAYVATMVLKEQLLPARELASAASSSVEEGQLAKAA